ncbi:hypothetical protein GDO81_002268 [Engystomops pustulosus]|uniref:Uncharacterized protein n=1 Tax=Engystomops pustulosus TaxID=76066 RepID=A0AAV7DIM6_ENGPU|nr:hypothetical protein GDO81_002268 [Engystomops pustulosus]
MNSDFLVRRLFGAFSSAQIHGTRYINHTGPDPLILCRLELLLVGVMSQTWAEPLECELLHTGADSLCLLCQFSG